MLLPCIPAVPGPRRRSLGAGPFLVRVLAASRGECVRASHGLVRLRIDYRLESLARAHSVDMLRRHYFAHGAFSARVNSSGAAGPIFGEDLPYRPVSALWVVNAWLASPEHRANLLRPGFCRVGIGAVIGTFEGGAGTLVVTADFAGS